MSRWAGSWLRRTRRAERRGDGSGGWSWGTQRINRGGSMGQDGLAAGDEDSDGKRGEEKDTRPTERSDGELLVAKRGQETRREGKMPKHSRWGERAKGGERARLDHARRGGEKIGRTVKIDCSHQWRGARTSKERRTRPGSKANATGADGGEGAGRGTGRSCARRASSGAGGRGPGLGVGGAGGARREGRGQNLLHHDVVSGGGPRRRGVARVFFRRGFGLR